MIVWSLHFGSSLQLHIKICRCAKEKGRSVLLAVYTLISRKVKVWQPILSCAYAIPLLALKVVKCGLSMHRFSLYGQTKPKCKENKHTSIPHQK